MIEVLIAICLTSWAIMALLGLQAPGWKSMAKADYVGRASGILYKTLENYETHIMNPCYSVTLGNQTVEYLKTSGQTSSISGDVTYTVNTNIVHDVDSSGNSVTGAFLVTVQVTWTNNTTGISESMVVARQERSRFPTGCTNGLNG